MFYWIDSTAHVAYIAVRGALTEFREVLAVFDKLFADPRWKPDMPIVSDVRELTAHPSASSIVDHWRAYVRQHHPLVSGGHWAIVARDGDTHLREALSAAAVDAASSQVTMQIFSSMTDAHVWLARRARSWLM